jgi:hypothetical protein
MKTKFTFIIFILASFSIYAQPVMLGNLEGNETYFTGFNGKVYFASGTKIQVADTLSKSIHLVADLPETVIGDLGYSRSFDGNLRVYKGSVVTRFPVAGDFIYPLTKPQPDSISIWRIDKSETIIEKIGVFDTIENYVEFKNDLYFSASKAGCGFQIWKVDQNGAISQLTNWEKYSNSIYLIPGEDFLYFDYRGKCVSNEECANYSSLYKSDGTIEGTIEVSEDFEAIGKGWIRNLVFFKDNLYYIYADTIWKYDNDVITPFVDNTGYDDYHFSNILKVNNYLIYEIVHEMSPDNRLYSIEAGTGAGVFLAGYGDGNNFFPVGDQLFYYNRADYYIGSFHKTDGTSDGTQEFIARIREYAVANRFQAVRSYMFYSVNEDYYAEYLNYELYQTDLTTEGSRKVQDIFGGTQSYDMVNNFAEANGVLFFTAGEKPSSMRTPPSLLYYYNLAPDIISAVKQPDAMVIDIHPNPTTNTCFIKADVQGTILLTDALGKPVLEEKFSQEGRLDLSKLASGVYFIRLLTTGNNVIVDKIVKQ